MYKSIDKTANFTFATQVNKELRPDSRLKYVRQSDDKEGNNSEFLNGDFHSLLFNFNKGLAPNS
jgi:hypothetical protein